MNSSSSPEQPMAISSITCSYDLDIVPSSSSKRKRYEPCSQRMVYSHSHPGTLLRSPPTTPETLVHSPPSPSHSFSYQQHYEHDQLYERRQRNKAASAKYRQKKNSQQNEMRIMIRQISDRNAVLERQLQEVREENHKLVATADKLRGKLEATRLIRHWIKKNDSNNRAQLLERLSSDDDSYDEIDV